MLEPLVSPAERRWQRKKQGKKIQKNKTEGVQQQDTVAKDKQG